MKIYINGDSHAAAAEAACPHAFAEDDGDLLYLGRCPHPSNLTVSYGKCLADMLKAVHHTDAESASSNARIIKTTRQWAESHEISLAETVMIVQWSTWEREEWVLDGKTYQVTGSGTDDVPAKYRDRYRQWIVDLDWTKCTIAQHDAIWQLHQDLESRNVKHVFFNGNNDFSSIPIERRMDWGVSYLGPYDPQSTFHQVLQNQGFSTVSPSSWHYGPDAHAWWARYLKNYLVAKKFF